MSNFACVQTLRTNGGAIRVRRQTLGLTQGELARKAELTQSYIARVEYGERGLGGKARGRVAEALGVTVEDITTVVDTDDEPAPVTA
jgi:transcriptional regulator with XRE-family HTH domain